MKRLLTVVCSALIAMALPAWAQNTSGGNGGVVNAGGGGSGTTTFRLNRFAIPTGVTAPNPVGDNPSGHPDNPYKGDYGYAIFATRISRQTGKDAEVVGGANFHVDSMGVIKGRGIYWIANRAFRITGEVNLSGKGKLKVYYEGGGLNETWLIKSKDLAVHFFSDQQKGEEIGGLRVPSATATFQGVHLLPMSGFYTGPMSNKATAYFLVDTNGYVIGAIRQGSDVRKVAGHATAIVTGNKVTGATFSVSSKSAHIQMNATYKAGQFVGTWSRGIASTAKNAAKGSFKLTKLH
jgi:hypothetical protein